MSPPLIFLSGQITNGYWLNVAGTSRGDALSSFPCVPGCPLNLTGVYSGPFKLKSLNLKDE